MPSPLFSTGSPPVTTLISSRPSEIRSSVAAMRAATLWRLQAGPHRDEKAQPLGQRRQGRGDDPGILAARPVGSSTPK